MSKHIAIHFKEETIWAYDVYVSVLLKFVLDSAVDQIKSNESNWLKESIENWKVNAVVSDFGVYLNENLTTKQLLEVKTIINQACLKLSTKTILLKEEIERWSIIDHQGIDLREEKKIQTKYIIELGEAFRDLLEGTLAQTPEGCFWYYGVNGKITINEKN